VIYNVMDPPYNAVGNGTTDDSGAIQSAANDAGAAGGGIVYLPTPPVAYAISTGIQLQSNTTIEGDNTGSTTVLALNGMVTFGGLSSIMVTNTMADSGPFSAIVQSYITVRNLTFNNNAPGNMSSGTKDEAAVYFDGAGYLLIENCTVKNCFNHGISVQLNDDPTTSAPGFIRILNNVVDIMPTRAMSGGKYVLTSGNLSMRVMGLDNVIIDGNMIGFQNETWANDAIDTPGSSSVAITNNLITWSTDGIGTELDSDYTIAGNLISNCIGYGIRSFQNMSGSEATNRIAITNNVVVGVSPGDINPTLGPTLTGIHVDQGGNNDNVDCIVSGNILYGPFDAAGINVGAVQGTCVGNMVDLQGHTYTSTGITIGNDNWTVSGNTIRFGTTGIAIPSVQNNLVVEGNNLKNLTNLLTATSGYPKNSKISQNVGFNPPDPSTISQPGIGTSLVTNANPFDCMVYIWGGSGVQVAVDGAPSMATGTPISIRVPATGTIKLAYTTAPTWYWIPE
jgi:Pectate lyase superfamily protein/Right handed beta helix region